MPRSEKNKKPLSSKVQAVNNHLTGTKFSEEKKEFRLRKQKKSRTQRSGNQRREVFAALFWEIISMAETLT